MSKQAKVAALPNCDVCRMGQKATVAYADAAVPATGSWGYLCREHFDLYGCQLGTGRGQELIVG